MTCCVRRLDEYGYAGAPRHARSACGCITGAFLDDIAPCVWYATVWLTNLLLDPYFRDAITSRQGALRRWCRPVRVWIPGAQRIAGLLRCLTDGAAAGEPHTGTADYFGAHTYRRIDREGVFHSEWGEP